jgi:hypothetical protein
MTVSEILKDPLFSHKVLSMAIYGEKSRCRLYQKLNNKGLQKINSTDLQRISNYFKEKYKIDLDCI